eukprot:2073656-Rhodomonas_salina.1
MYAHTEPPWHDLNRCQPRSHVTQATSSASTTARPAARSVRAWGHCRSAGGTAGHMAATNLNSDRRDLGISRPGPRY